MRKKKTDSSHLILSLILTLGTYQEQNRCLPCHGSCLSCSGPERINCLSCPAGTRLHDYICQSCALGTYYESLSNKCNKCHQGCSTCSGPLTSDCMSCMDPNLHLDENNTCVPCCNTHCKFIGFWFILLPVIFLVKTLNYILSRKKFREIAMFTPRHFFQHHESILFFMTLNPVLP